MSATEEDTELRDLLIQNLENSGVLNKIKAELRAAVFVALEEQEKQEKTPLENECLKKCLNTKDGRLAASLISDFMQVYNLDFTLAVFQPEVNSSVDGRESVCRELGVHEGDINRNSAVLLEVIRRGRHRDKSHPTTNEVERSSQVAKELSPRQIAEARKKFDSHSKDKAVKSDDLTAVFVDLCPSFKRSMLDCYVKDELAARGKDSSSTVDFQEFLGMWKRFFMQCRSVVMSDAGDTTSPAVRGAEDRVGNQPLSRILSDAGDSLLSAVKGLDDKINNLPASRDTEIPRLKGQTRVSLEDSHIQVPEVKGQSVSTATASQPRKTSQLGEEDDAEDDVQDDSFFDDPLPKPQKTYGSRVSSVDRSVSDRSSSQRDKNRSAGSEGKRPGGADASHRNDDEVNYDDDFNSHRSENSRSEISIGEEIEEGSLDFSEKVDSTLDVSVSQLSEGAADYLEEVS